MRREVMSLINEGRDGSGWALRIERAIMLGFWRRSYSLAAFAVFIIISISGLAQMRQTTPATWRSAAVFDRGNMLFRPEGYRNWAPVAPSSLHQSSDVGTGATSTPAYRVYINPLGYREDEKTGSFPDGTLLVWEAVTREPDTAPRPHQQSSLLVSVKDGSRFGEAGDSSTSLASVGPSYPKHRSFQNRAGARGVTGVKPRQTMCSRSFTPSCSLPVAPGVQHTDN